MAVSNSRLVSHRREGNLVVFELLASEVSDAQTSGELRTVMLEAAAGSPCSGIVVDLTACTFLGSIGLLAFMALRRENPGTPIVFVGVTDTIHDMLHHSRLIPNDNEPRAVFEVGADVAEVVARLN